MEWFSGSIPEAISSSKNQESIFVVFVSDSSEASNTSEASLGEAASELKQHTVAIKLDNTSDECKQFSQIYPVVVLPSIYFINPVSGVPVEILAGPVTSALLTDKLPAILAAGKTSSASDGESTSTASADATEQISTQIAEDSPLESAATEQGDISAPAAASDDACDAKKDGDESVAVEEEHPDSRLPSEQTSAAGSSSGGEETPPSLQERVARAKALAEQRQREKEEELRQKNITEEAQRREMGKEMRRIKREQEEKEMKEIATERRKDKEMDRLARERVIAQIAADRAERETRAALLRGDAAPPPSPPTAPVAASTPSPGPASSVCRIKLRLPDGSSMLAQFPPSAPLSAVRQHLLDQGSLPFTQFRLASSLHQRPYSDTDMDTSLADLALAPSAIIIVMTTGRSAGAVVTSSGGLFNNLLWLLLLPYNAVMGVIRSVFGGDAPARPSSRGATDQPQTGPRADGGGDAVRRRTDRPKTAYGTRTEARLRREGNIHRLGNEDDSDENNTWNGNSTQQM